MSWQLYFCIASDVGGGDRSSCYCVLDESGRMVLEQKVSTAPKGLHAALGAMPRAAGSHWKPGRICSG
jgi:hypothetical protein